MDETNNNNLDEKTEQSENTIDKIGEELNNNEENVETSPVSQLIDPDAPITRQTIRDVGRMVQETGERVRVMKSIWEDTKKEFNLKDGQLKELYVWNNNNRDPEPESSDDSEEHPDYDRYNGFDKLTDEEIVRIFGEDHLIIGVDTQQTIDRIKYVFAELIECMAAMREYKNVHDAYAMLMEMYDDQNIQELQEVCDKETDPEKKAEMQKTLDNYRSKKNLGFLKEPMEPEDIKRLVRGFTTRRTCEYWMKRSINKLKQLKISGTFLQEIWAFEKRFLDEKYHRLNNMTVAYFMQLIVYCKCSDNSSTNIRRAHVLFMFAALDGFVQNRIPPERKDAIKESIEALLDQMMEYIPEDASTINDQFGDS